MILRRRQADLVRVYREWVRYLIRLGCNLPDVEPERKSRVRAGDGFSRDAKRTANQSSDLAVAETNGSEDDNILIA